MPPQTRAPRRRACLISTFTPTHPQLSITSSNGMRATRRVCGVSVSRRRDSDSPGLGAGSPAPRGCPSPAPESWAESGTWMAKLAGRRIVCSPCRERERNEE